MIMIKKGEKEEINRKTEWQAMFQRALNGEKISRIIKE